MCRLLDVSKSGFYAWLSRTPSPRAKENARLTRLVEEVFDEHKGRYGYPRVHAELVARGERVGRKRIARLMQAQKLRVKPRRRYRVTTKPGRQAAASNILDRKFNAAAPNQKWAGDITFIETREGWLYLAVILDLFSRRVVGWSMSRSMHQKLTLDALKMALKQRESFEGCIHHSDRGAQYTSGAYRTLLKSFGLRASMSRQGNCWDNAVAESFFASLEKDLLLEHSFETRDEARGAVFEYIEVYYNQRRRHSTLGYLTPTEYEEQFAAKAVA